MQRPYVVTFLVALGLTLASFAGVRMTAGAALVPAPIGVPLRA